MYYDTVVTNFTLDIQKGRLFADKKIIFVVNIKKMET